MPEISKCLLSGVAFFVEMNFSIIVAVRSTAFHSCILSMSLFPLKHWVLWMFHCPLKYFTQMHQREHGPPRAVTSKSSCSMDGVTDTEVHSSFLSGVVMMVSWSLGHWRCNLESPNRPAVKSSKTAA